MLPEDGDELDPVATDEAAAAEAAAAEAGADDDAANEADADAGDGDAAAAADEELVVTIGDDPPPDEEDPAKAPEWVRELRKSNREKDRRIRELEQRVATAAPAPQAVVVGERPKLADFDFDEDKFGAALDAWLTRKSEADAQAQTKAREAAQQQAHWQTRIDAIAKAATGLKLPDYDDAAQAFEDLFPNVVHRGIIMGGPDDAKTSALLRYALGKNPKKAKELAAIADPVKFAFAVAKLESQLKITPRKVAPAPDTVVRSSVAGAAAVDSTLKRLQEQADKTGDRTKVAQYMRDKSRKAA